MLLRGPLRTAGAALLAACVAAVLAAFLAGRGRPGWLDTRADPQIESGLSHFPVLLNWLPDLGTLGPVTLMTLALALAYAAARRWSGAVLTLVAVPAAIALTEYVLKPYVGTRIGQSFPSGHATSSFALAVIFALLLADQHRFPRAFRSLLVLLALLLAAAVTAAMVAIGAHTFTDAVAGTAVGTGVVLACALALDLATPRLRRPRRTNPNPAELPIPAPRTRTPRQ